MLLNHHIGCIVLGLLCVGVRVWFGWGGIRAASSLTLALTYGKVTAFPVKATKAYGGSESVAPLLNLGTTQKSVISFTPAYCLT